ncbi:MAG: transaldolase family protein [bacterium]|nr:transaldolase family protein [bacterium]
MKIFIDSANLTDIEEGLKRGFAQGVTTNPSLLAKEPKSSFEEHVKKIVELINRYQPGMSLSIEVFSKDPSEILSQAQRFVKDFSYPQLSIKVQIGWNELETIAKLSKMGISVNCTACMSVTQAVMAARAGAKYVSIFWGRIRDGGTELETAAQRNHLKSKKTFDDKDFDPEFVVNSTRKILDNDKVESEIIVGSIRSLTDIRDAGIAGAHIVTIPPKFFPDMTSHFKTDQVVNQFLNDFKSWLS